jgi:hypothetical protein
LKETDAGKIDVSRGQALDTAGALLVLVANTDGRNNAVASEAIPRKMMRELIKMTIFFLLISVFSSIARHLQ